MVSTPRNQTGQLATPPIVAYDAAPPLDDTVRRAADGELLLCWDRPDRSGEAVAAPVLVSGWAYARCGVAEVWVVVDGTHWVQAVHGQWRGDIVAAVGSRDGGSSGFNAMLPERDCPAGSRDITVIALARDGSAVGLSAQIEVAPREQPGPPSRSGSARPAQPLDGNGERFVPELHPASMMEAEHQARYRWALPLAEGRDVLDAGCGVGWGSALLHAAGARSLVGLDVDPPALDSARARTPEAEFVRGDLAQLPFEDASFDLVVCFEAIEHVPDPERVLDELRRVLRDDGVLLISSPNRGVYPAGNPHHLHELTSAELSETLGRRFANVAAWRQQTHIGSALLDDAAFAADDPAVPLDADLRKVVAGEPGDELYTVAACSDAPLPQLRATAVLTRELDVKAWIETIAQLEHRSLLAEAEANTSAAEVGIMQFEHDRALMRLQETERARQEAERRLAETEQRAAEAEQRVAAAEQRAAEAEHWLAEHRGSASWRLTVPLRTAKQRAATLRERG